MKVSIRLTVLIAVCFFSLTCTNAGAQRELVIGTVKNNKTGKPVASASVIIKNGAGNVLHFGITNNAGAYSIAVPDTLRRYNAIVEVNCLGYKSVRQPFLSGQNQYTFYLDETVTELKEVKVRSNPVSSKRDTISYDVVSFSRKEDRSIGDVISHMPGMTVTETGEIYYNGKQISNLYIHGDNLMDGRYGLATRAITKEMIKSVEVLDHFQPIKVLRNKALTNDVVVNLVLKDENSLKVSGQATAGAGLPEQYDGILNTMMFNRKFKMLNSAKANNSGVDYRNEFTQYNADAFLSSVGDNRPFSLLQDATAGNPDLPRQNYYLNHSEMVNANNLYNTKSGVQFRSNIQVFGDRNTFDYTGRNDFYLPADTIHYRQQQQAVRHAFILNSAFTTEINKNNLFFSDRLSFNLSDDHNNSALDFNGRNFTQDYSKRVYDLSNMFQWVPRVRGANAMYVNWYLGYFRLPQQIYATNGLDSDILNSYKPYLAVRQDAVQPSFVSHITSSYSKGQSTTIFQRYEAGVLNEWQQLNSTLQLVQLNGDENAYKGDPGNAVRWQRHQVHASAAYSVARDYWQANLKLPLAYQSIQYSQPFFGAAEKKQNILFNPAADLTVYTSAENYFAASYSYTNNTGNIGGVYRGLVLTSYQALHANDALLQDQSNSSAGLTYYFKRSVQLLFINAGIRYNRVTASSILSTTFTNQVQTTRLLPYENDQSSLNGTLGISKYVFPLKTKLSFSASWARGYYDQFVNSLKLKSVTDNYRAVFGVDGKLPANLVLTYTAVGNWSNSRQTDPAGGQSFTTGVRRFDQTGSLAYSGGGLYVVFKAHHIYSEQPGLSAINYLFTDASVRYRIAAWRADISLDLTNLSDITRYEVLGLNTNQLSYNSYQIRGRMAVVRVVFNL